MQIGNFGSDLVFKVSDEQVLTFNNFSRTVKSKWVEHAGIDINPASEYVSRELDSISLTVVLSAELGVKPRAMIEKLESLCKNGSVRTLVIGNKRVGSGSFYIEQISEAWDYIYSRGELWQATISISFKEYGD